MAFRILIHGDSRGPVARLGNQLAASGFAVELIIDPGDVARRLQQDPRPLVLVPSSSLDAEERCSMLRRASDSPIVVVLPDSRDAQFNENQTAAAWLEAGADTVISGEPGRRELAARLRAVLRGRLAYSIRAMAAVPVRFGALEIDDTAHTVTAAGKAVSLTPTEFRLFVALAQRLGRTVSRADLITELWGGPTADDNRTLRLYVGYLRRKLQAAGPGGPTVLNQRGIGYRLMEAAGLKEGAAS